MDREHKRSVLIRLTTSITTTMHYLIDLEKTVLSITKRILETLHGCENLLLLKPAANDLNTNWKAVHLLSIVVLVGALCDTVELLKVEGGREAVEVAVYVSYWDDAGGVVDLVDC